MRHCTIAAPMRFLYTSSVDNRGNANKQRDLPKLKNVNESEKGKVKNEIVKV